MVTATKARNSKGFEEIQGGSPVEGGDKVTGEVVSSDKDSVSGDAIASLGDTQFVTIAWVAEALKIQSNTIVRRYLPEKVLPAFEGLNCPALRTESGKLTGFGAKAIAQYVHQCVQGGRSYEEWKTEIRSRYPAEAINAELVEDEIPEVRTSWGILQRSESEYSDTTQAMMAALLYKRQQVEEKRLLQEAMEKKRQQEQALQEAIAQELRSLQEQEIRLNAQIQAKAVIQQMGQE